MGYRMNIQRSQLFMESTEEFNKHWFSYTRDKFYHNIDTYYYSLSIENDYNKNPEANDLIFELQELKNQSLATSNKMIELPCNKNLFVTRGRFDDIYQYRLTCPMLYDIFVTSYLPNQSTPRFLIQLRSEALWTRGIKETIEESYNNLKIVLDEFGLKVGNVVENRIDYCYHTNYIQDMYTFFKDSKMEVELKSNMRNWRKEGHIFDDGWELNYFALGSRKSKTTFIRIYDKTREVVERGYKAFFLDIWLKDGLISRYDEYILKYCYEKKNYEKRFEAMLKFYLEHGRDTSHQLEILHYLEDFDANFYQIRELALSLMPQTTTICNIEFQTLRMFYKGGDDMICNFETLIKTDDKLQRLIKIVDNRKIFLNYLTHYNLRFVEKDGTPEDCVYKSWWSRLRGLKITSLDCDKEYARKYQHELDLQLMKKRVYKTIGTYTLYNGGDIDSSFADDIVDYINTMNDNDIQTYFGYDYKEHKKEKYQNLRNQLNLTEVSDSENKD